jgi:hypothetical protein
LTPEASLGLMADRLAGFEFQNPSFDFQISRFESEIVSQQASIEEASVAKVANGWN